MKDKELSFWTTSPNAFLVAESASGRVLGCISYQQKNADTAEMNRLSVDSNFRGLKLGESLVKGLIEEAKKNGYKSMYLETSDVQVAAWKLYERLGFGLVRSYAPDEHFFYKFSGMKILCYEKSI